MGTLTVCTLGGGEVGCGGGGGGAAVAVAVARGRARGSSGLEHAKRVAAAAARVWVGCIPIVSSP